MNTLSELKQTWSLSEGVETLSACPVCNSGDATVLHAGLEDRLFAVPGTWTLWQCHSCDVEFLNPRLTEDTIGQAYQTYHTHSAPKRTLRVRLREFVMSTYAKRHLGAGPGLPWNWSDWVVRWRFPALTQRLSESYRFLPRYRAGAVLLDIGCGNGDFLLQAKPLGWRVVGLEIDPRARAIATARGLNVVEGSLPHTGLPGESFDVVMLNHVIEHVHDPRAVMRELFRLVRPGGKVYLTTPNRRSYGANLFGPSWRGLEPPRHLVLFTPDALVKLVTDGGFVKPEIRVEPEVANFYFRQSYAIATSADPRSVTLSPELAIELERARATARSDANRAEEFTVIAMKSNNGRGSI
jgi:2-polyprenyl-3-methyl-5-hydroxy-6-metoxy-1,4-benzoquinol methylase